MQELLEMIEDLETISTMTMHPALEETIERILQKYEQRKDDLKQTWNANMNCSRRN